MIITFAIGISQAIARDEMSSSLSSDTDRFAGSYVSFSQVACVAVFLTFSYFDIALVLVTQCVIVLFLAAIAAIALRSDEHLRGQILSTALRELAPAGLEIVAKLCASGERIMLVVKTLVSALTGKNLDVPNQEAVIKQHSGALIAEIPYHLRGADYVLYATFDNSVDKNRKTYVVTQGERKEIPIHPGVGAMPTAEMLGADRIENAESEMETF